MTFQPPPEGGSPAEQPSSQWSPPPTPPPAAPMPPPAAPMPPPASHAYNRPASGFDAKSVNALDWGILAAGLLAFIFSLFDYYKGKFSTHGCGAFAANFGSAPTESAWHGFFGWFAALCALAGAAAVAVELFGGSSVKLPFPTRTAALAAFALGGLSVILALFIHPGTGQSVHESVGSCHISASVGHGFAYWVSLIVILGGLVLSLMRFQQKGGQLPGALSKIPNIGGGPSAS